MINLDAYREDRRVEWTAWSMVREKVRVQVYNRLAHRPTVVNSPEVRRAVWTAVEGTIHFLHNLPVVEAVEFQSDSYYGGSPVNSL